MSTLNTDKVVNKHDGRRWESVHVGTIDFQSGNSEEIKRDISIAFSTPDFADDHNHLVLVTANAKTRFQQQSGVSKGHTQRIQFRKLTNDEYCTESQCTSFLTNSGALSQSTSPTALFEIEGPFAIQSIVTEGGSLVIHKISWRVWKERS